MALNIRKRLVVASMTTVVVAGIVSLLAGNILPASAQFAGPAKQEQTAWQRVIGSGRIKCGFISYAPYFIKDPNTGALSGVDYEIMEAIGRKLDFRIEWSEEVGYATIFDGLDAGRYDALCSGLWENSSRGKRGYFSVPLFFNAIRIWVRNDETRFKTAADLNAASVRIAVQDGAIEEVIAQKDFPNAQRISIPQLNPWTDNLLNIVTKKADVTFAEKGVITPFLAKNPGALKELPTARPPRVFATSIPIRMGEADFKSALDAAINELLNDGTIESILVKYEKSPGELLRVAPPYQPQ